MNKINLEGKWLLEEIGGSHKCEATVPSCNFIDLQKANIIPNPLVEMNENATQWVAKSDWQYSRTFELDTDGFSKEKIELVCEMLDTLCEVYVNGQLVGKANNINRTFVFDIKKTVKKGKNSILVKFFSPFEYIKQQQKLNPLPNSTMGEAGSCHIRKSPYHFGWDWGPHLLPCGISRPIYVRCFEKTRIKEVKCKQLFEDEKAYCCVECCLSENVNAEFEFILSFGSEIVTEYRGVENQAKLKIDEPKLWWCNGLGKQPLYKLEYKVFVDGQEVDHGTMQIGLRTIELDTKKDKFGENFCFVINGEKIFARGANWIATDSFVNNTTAEKLEELVVKAKVANFNMLRVWGGAYYESDKFFELCDKYGILVWQDCNFACSPYPFDNQEFCENVHQEIIDNVRRLRHHASLCLWCGNNEIESMSMAWIYRKDIITQTGEFFYKTLRKWIKENDEQTSYWACTPSSGVYMKKINSDNCGDTHLWHVWHGLRPLNFYRKRYTRFCSEFGIESLPSLNALDIFAQKQADSLDTSVMKLHQKCAGGNSKMLYYTLSRYWEPKKFEDMTYLTQIAQMECVREATEHWRRNKGRCNGSLYWQYNDCWGVSSWSGMDYYGNLKALQYMAKHFNKPLCVSVENTEQFAKIFVSNDLLESFEGQIKWGIETFDGELLHFDTRAVNVPKGKVEFVEEVIYNEKIKIEQIKNSFFFVDVLDKEGACISSRSMPLLTENKCNFPKAQFVFGIEASNGIATITIQSSTYARFVELRIKGNSNPFSDNFFDLRPNKIKTITIEMPYYLTKEDVENLLEIKTLCNMERKNSRLKDKFIQAKIFLTPINFVNWIARFFDK